MPNDEAGTSLQPEIVMRAKAELRKRLRALRRTTPATACAKRSERIVERLLAMDVVERATRVALFWPMEERHEVDLRPLDASLRARRVEIAYPSVDAEHHEMTFRVAEGKDLVDDALGFRDAPASLREAASLDVVVVPSLALDETGRRLGYGGGFYDRALLRFASAIKIGVAYDFQLLVEVPSFASDVPMDWVVTDARSIDASVASQG
jgi:5-formyltetrahydrofolate cyclo-ligase